MRLLRRTGQAAALAAFTTAFFGAAGVPPAAAQAVTVVARGLNNPRGVEVGPSGSVYVAEAGRAGNRCRGRGDEQICVGFTGSITRITSAGQRRIVRGLFSVGSRDGSFATGADDVAVARAGRVGAANCNARRAARVVGLTGRAAASRGRLYVIMAGAGPNPGAFGAAVARQVGRLLAVSSGRCRSVANIGRVEVTRNPDREDVNPNPYSVAVGAGRTVVADAGGNTLLSVRSGGRVSLLAVLPSRTFGESRVQSVPTSVTVGPDGAFYVGELGGDGMPPGEARVWRVVPGQAPTVYATGFDTIVGVDFGPDGSLYVAELLRDGFPQLARDDFTGSLTRVAPDGTRTELAPGRLAAVGGVAVSRGGKIFVSVNSVFPGRGRVVRIAG